MSGLPLRRACKHGRYQDAHFVYEGMFQCPGGVDVVPNYKAAAAIVDELTRTFWAMDEWGVYDDPDDAKEVLSVVSRAVDAALGIEEMEKQ